MNCTFSQALDHKMSIIAGTSILTRFFPLLGGSPYPRMDGRKVINFLQEGHRMQKPEHVDNKLLVEHLTVYFHGNFAQVIISIQS